MQIIYGQTSLPATNSLPDGTHLCQPKSALAQIMQSRLLPYGKKIPPPKNIHRFEIPNTHVDDLKNTSPSGCRDSKERQGGRSYILLT